ncbi:MAG: hypothetical protein AB1630_05595 [bacterium]
MKEKSIAHIQIETFDKILNADFKTAFLFIQTLNQNEPEGRTLWEGLKRKYGQEKIEEIRQLPSKEEDMPLPGTVRFVAIEPGNPPQGYHSIFLSGEIVNEECGSLGFYKKDAHFSPTLINGLSVPGEGALAATEFLEKEGFIPLKETRLIGVGYISQNLHQESASLSQALSLISFATGNRICDKIVPSAGLEKTNGEWHLKEVDNVDIKLQSMPEECTMILSESQGISQTNKKVVFCKTLEDVIKKIWPKFAFLKEDLRKKREEANKTRKNLNSWRLFISILMFLIVLEIGLLEEWALPSNFPAGIHPGWMSLSSLKAIVLSLIAATIMGIGHWWQMGKLARFPLAEKESFYLNSILFYSILGLITFFSIALFLPQQVESDPRSAVFKALFILGLADIIFILPSFNALSWVWLYKEHNRFLALSRLLDKNNPYPSCKLLCQTSSQILYVATTAIMALGSLTWYFWINLDIYKLWRKSMPSLEQNYDFLITSIHLMLQVILYVALAGVAYVILWRVEKEIKGAFDVASKELAKAEPYKKF